MLVHILAILLYLGVSLFVGLFAGLVAFEYIPGCQYQLACSYEKAFISFLIGLFTTIALAALLIFLHFRNRRTPSDIPPPESPQ